MYTNATSEGVASRPILNNPAQVAGPRVENRRATDRRAEEDRPAPTGPRLRNGPARQLTLVPQSRSFSNEQGEFTPIIPRFTLNDEGEFSPIIPRVVSATVRSPIETPRASAEWQRGDPLPDPLAGLQRSQSLAPNSTRRRRIIGTSTNRNGAPLRSFQQFREVSEARRQEVLFLERSGILLAAPQQSTSVRDAYERDEYLYLVQTARPDSSDDEDQAEEVVPRRRRRRRSAGGPPIPRERIRPGTGSSERERSRIGTQRPLTEEERIARQNEVVISYQSGRPRGLGVFLEGSVEERRARMNEIINRRNTGRSQ